MVTQPQILVCLGATAAHALLGNNFSVSRQRGRFVSSSLAPLIMATVHPSSILRAPDEASRHEQKQAFIRDLKLVASRIRRLQNAA
jgi:DNA polymerase